jgi:hypothetical protein
MWSACCRRADDAFSVTFDLVLTRETTRVTSPFRFCAGRLLGLDAACARPFTKRLSAAAGQSTCGNKGAFSNFEALISRRIWSIRTSPVLRSSCAGIPTMIDMDSRIDDNGSMKTTVDIPENELKDAIRFTKAKTKREAVVRVLEEFNRRRRMAELVRYSGTFTDGFPTNEEIEAVDATRDLGLYGRRSRR